MSQGIAQKLLDLDRRWLYLLLFLVVTISHLLPIKTPAVPLPWSQKAWDAVEAVPDDKIIIINSSWGLGSRGENMPQLTALLTHVMAKRKKFVLATFYPTGLPVAQSVLGPKVAEYGYRYGEDYLTGKYSPQADNFVKAFAANPIEALGNDGVQKRSMTSFPMMQNIKSLDDIALVIEVSASGFHEPWIRYLPQKPVIFFPTSIMAPEALPYLDAGQLEAIVWGVKGAYDYELLNEKAGIGRLGIGSRYAVPLSAGIGLMVLAVVIGNIAAVVVKRGEK